MDVDIMNSFKIVMLIVAMLIIASIAGYVIYSAKAKQRPNRGVNEMHEDTPQPEYKQEVEIKIEEPVSAIEQETEKKGWADYYQLFVIARSGSSFSISDLRNVFSKIGLPQGQGGFYYCNDEGKQIFRIANLVKPGNFPAQSSSADGWKTKGISLIMMMPKSERCALDMLEKTIIGAATISKYLGAVVCGNDMKPLTPEQIDEYRSQVKAFDERP